MTKSDKETTSKTEASYDSLSVDLSNEKNDTRMRISRPEDVIGLLHQRILSFDPVQTEEVLSLRGSSLKSST